MSKSVIVIGAGFSGLSVATCLSNAGYKVTVIEKHEQPGGRARKFSADGFTFDMGPSWYWMPDVFEKYFALFGKKPSDYYNLIRLNPSYSVVWNENEKTDLPANLDELIGLFDSIDSGSGKKLNKFLTEAKYKYEIGVNKLVYKPGRSIAEFADLELLAGIIKLDVFKSMSKHVRKITSNKRLLQILEFPVLFLGALSKDTPALYSLMNYADMALGTWFPEGGMYKIVEAMYQLALEQEVKFEFSTDIKELKINDGNISQVISENKTFTADVIVSSADYHYVETNLIPIKYRSYSEKYWETRKMAPSSLLYYIGLNKKIEGLPHHTLFFDTDFEVHADEIYSNPKWPTNPLFYLSLTTKTDLSGAPDGYENVFILIPVAAGLIDTDVVKDKYFDLVMKRLEKYTSIDIKSHIVFKRTFAYRDFVNDYGAYKGNAYGLANTLLQTAILKPSCKSKKLKNLFYTGQLTVPGPGVPPSLISGQVVAKEILKEFPL
jgi:phytoene desaturase